MKSSRRRFIRNVAATAGISPALLASLPGGETRTAAAQPATVTPAPDVGSLFPFIQSQAARADYSLSWLQPKFKSVAAWKRKARGRLLELLHYTPAKCDPRAEILERKDCGDYFRELVHFNTTPDIRVPAYVLVPKRAKFPAPGIVALHDHGAFYFWGKEKLVELENQPASLTAFKQQYYEGISTASELARQGYVVIVIDMFYWGERRMLLEGDPEDWRERPASITTERVKQFNQRASQSEPLVGRSIYAAGFTWPAVVFWDDLRTVDYLVSRPEVDQQRIGCVGLSVGGFRSCHLAALDDRIKAAVVVGWMTSFPHQLRKQIIHTIGHTMLVPGLYQQMDYPDVASLAMPSALLVINGSKDTLFHPDGVSAAFDKLTAGYKKAGWPEKLRLRLYDTPHEFNREMQAEAWDWLRKWV